MPHLCGARIHARHFAIPQNFATSTDVKIRLRGARPTPAACYVMLSILCSSAWPNVATHIGCLDILTLGCCSLFH